MVVFPGISFQFSPYKSLTKRVFESCRQEISSALSDESCPSETGDSLLSVETGEPGELDALMLGLWNMCNDDGLFRYDVTACSTKVLPGVYGFIAQLNEGRATKKRPTEFRVDQVNGVHD